MVTRVDPLATALAYAARGWPVLPCHTPTFGVCSCAHTDCASPGKHPRVPKGLTGATVDRALIQQWWRRWPDANVAVRTGQPSGLVVDIDRRGGGDKTVSELVDRNGRLPATLAVRTGDGVHLYFSHPGQSVSNDASRRLGPGIDIRGDGGYVLAPPSLHHGGLRYETIDPDAPVAPMPDWMIGRLVAPVRSEQIGRPSPAQPPLREASAWARAALDNEVRAVARAEVRTRNAALNRAAFSLGQVVAGGALHGGLVERSLLDAAMAVGLGDREARATIASGLRAGSQQPRSAPNHTTPTRPVNGGPANYQSVLITFVPWPKDFEGPSFPARSEYVERCWTSVLGPTSVLALRAIAQELERAGTSVPIDVAELGRSLGVGSGNGRQSGTEWMNVKRYGAWSVIPFSSSTSSCSDLASAVCCAINTRMVRVHLLQWVPARVVLAISFTVRAPESIASQMILLVPFAQAHPHADESGIYANAAAVRRDTPSRTAVRM